MILQFCIVSALVSLVAGSTEQHQIDVDIPLYPEGIAYDSSSDTIFLGSIGSPVIVTVDGTTMAVKKVKPFGDASDFNRCFGLYVDSMSQLWCSRSSLATGGDGAFVAYDLADVLSEEDGLLTPVGVATIPPSTTNSLDVVASEDGTAYGTDSTGRVVSIASDFTSNVISDSALLAPPAGASAGANGIELVTDKALIVANYGSKKLIRVDIETGEASDIATFDTPVGPDGLLLLKDGRLAAITYPFLTIMEEIPGTDWGEVNVTAQVNVALVEGEIATTIAQSESDTDHVFVTYVRFSEVLAGAFNSNSSMIAKVSLPSSLTPPVTNTSQPAASPTPEPTSATSATASPTPEPTSATSGGVVLVKQSLLLATVSAALIAALF